MDDEAVESELEEEVTDPDEAFDNVQEELPDGSVDVPEYSESDIDAFVDFSGSDDTDISNTENIPVSLVYTFVEDNEEVTVVIPEAYADEDTYASEEEEGATQELEIEDDITPETVPDEDNTISNTVLIPTIAAVSAGERVVIAVRNGVPTVIGGAGYGDAVADDLATAATDIQGLEGDTIKETHAIYYRKSSSGKPTAPTTWVTDPDTTQYPNENVYNAWTTKIPPLAASTDANASKYPFLYTCDQSKRYDGSIFCTTVHLDDNTTVIDGGTIVTGSVYANAIDADSGTFAVANIPVLNADKIDASSLTIGMSQVTNLNSTLNGKASTTDASNAAKTATNYITADSNGIKVHAANDTTNYAKITSSGLEIFKSSTSVADFGSEARIGATSGNYITINGTKGLLFSNATTVTPSGGTNIGTSMAIKTSYASSPNSYSAASSATNINRTLLDIGGAIKIYATNVLRIASTLVQFANGLESADDISIYGAGLHVKKLTNGLYSDVAAISSSGNVTCYDLMADRYVRFGDGEGNLARFATDANYIYMTIDPAGSNRTQWRFQKTTGTIYYRQYANDAWGSFVAPYWRADTSRTANYVLAAPDGSNGAATWRALKNSDLPTVDVAHGGTGYTQVTESTTVSSFLDAASGVTISNLKASRWGKLFCIYFTANPGSAKTSAWTAGTMKSGYRPNNIVTARPYYTSCECARITTAGAIQFSAATANDIPVSFTYLLP